LVEAAVVIEQGASIGEKNEAFSEGLEQIAEAKGKNFHVWLCQNQNVNGCVEKFRSKEVLPLTIRLIGCGNFILHPSSFILQLLIGDSSGD
jgi:hypothetical protein